MQRARSVDDKRERQRAILVAGRECFAEGRFADVRMSEVAERAGLAKGTVFLYFPTKEALFLGLLEEELTGWFEQLDGELSRSRARLSAKQVSRLICQSLMEREQLARLLSLLHVVLEQNVSEEQITPFKRLLLERLARTGPLLEGRLPFLAAGEGAQLLLRLNAVLIGLWQMSEPGPAVARVLATPEMAPLRIDFTKELAATVETLLVGYEQQRHG